MEKQNHELNNSLVTSYPWFLVEIIEGVELNSMYTDGFAEITVENKFQGKYMNICRVVGVPYAGQERLNAEFGDIVGVWATAIEKFELLSYGTVVMVRNADIFLRVVPNTPLYMKLLENARA